MTVPAPPFVIEPGLWCERSTPNRLEGRAALFLDRDGVLVEEVNYLSQVEDITLIGGVPEAVAEANRRGVAVIMVTNQAGIGRGYYGWPEFERVQAAIRKSYGDLGATFDMILACAYHSHGQGEYRRCDHDWRKPGPGMILRAAQDLGLDLARSFIVGDKLSDLEAGRTAGLPGGALVLTGHGKAEFAAHAAELRTPVDGFAMAIEADAAKAIRKWLQIRSA